MAGYENIVEEIKSRCNIVDVIGQVVQLKRAGSNYKGLCPFHNEKTPSFVVSESKQLFTCFGCGATGDTIEFVKRYYNLDFMEAIEKLAKEYSIPFEVSYGHGKNKEDYYEINRAAAAFFYEQFTKDGNPAFEYMKGRGINPHVLKRFGIGYADDNWDSLYKYLIDEKHFDREKVLELGLISVSGGKYFDKFRNRVMFPIINTRGKVIGFGGRILGDGNPKYLNSAESTVFLKKNNLYGINLTRQEIGKENCIVLVEGYMDVIGLYQAGIKNVSASLGTALTENQAKMIKRYTHNVVLSYDADEAGQNATLRGLEVLRGAGIKAKVLKVTDGKDPDEFVKKNGKDAYRKLMADAFTYAEYRLKRTREKYDLSVIEDRVDFVKDAVEVLKVLSPSEADIYIKKIAEETRISEGAIRLEFSGVSDPKNILKSGTQDQNEHNTDKISTLEKNIIKVLLTDINFWETISQYKDMFKSSVGINIYRSMAGIYGENDEIDIDRLFDCLSENDCKVLKDISENIFLGGKEEQVVEQCIASLKLSALKHRADEIISIINMADENENKEQIKKLTIEYQNLLQEMGKMKGDNI